MKKERGILYWLRVVACALAICLMFLRFSRGLKVCADEVTLTPEQTLALIGLDIEGQVYSNDLDTYVPCHAKYTGYLSSDFVPPNNSDTFYNYYSAAGSYPDLNAAVPLMNKRNYLIYAIYPTSTQAVGWPSWTINDNYARHDFSCNFSLPIQSCTQLKFSVLYSSASTYFGAYGNVNNSSAVVSTNGPVIGRHPIGQSNINTRYWLALTPFQKNGDTTHYPSTDVNERNRQSLAVLPLDYQAESPFSVYGFSLSLNMVRGDHIQYVDSPLYDPLLYDTYIPILYIQCPSISDYVPATTAPVTTRSPYGTAESGGSHQTVDLSNLESGVAAIVQQEQYNGDTLDWIGNNTMIAANNLAYICNRLDQIYAEMVKSGQIAVNLVSADPLHTLSPSVHSQIADALAAAEGSFTTAIIPGTHVPTAGITFYSTLYNKFTSDGLSFFGWFGIFSLMLFVVTWFIFRGRG